MPVILDFAVAANRDFHSPCGDAPHDHTGHAAPFGRPPSPNRKTTDLPRLESRHGEAPIGGERGEWNEVRNECRRKCHIPLA
jgi:hypothetical protein